MVDPASMKEMATTLGMFVTLVENMGVEGLVGLMLGGPFLAVSAVWAQSWSDRRHNQKTSDEFRKDISQLQEEHRKETAEILKKFGESLEKTTRYYENNALLVQNYEKLANDLHALIVTNIQTIGNLNAQLEAMRHPRKV